MTCEEFHRVLPELGSGNSLERVAHLRSCSQCAGLLADLNEIARQAKQLQASLEPSSQVWHSIETALRNEGLIRGGIAIDLPAQEAHSLEDETHLQSCLPCATVRADLDAISEQARLLQGAETPSPRVWNSIEIALRNEGLIRQPELERPRIRHASPRWKLAWLAPLAAAAAVILGMVMFQQGNGRQGSAHTADLASVVPAQLQDSTANPEEEQMVRLVAERMPALSAAFAADLKAVNDYIREAESSARANPQDETARQHLMSAYGQRAMIYEMAMDRSLQ
jgi:hypothetical protein